MSADVWIKIPACAHCGREAEQGAELNVTYNLTPMLREAGFMGWSELLGKPAVEAGKHMLEVLDAMATEPERWRAKNPPNGWGTYDGCLQTRMRAFAEECLKAAPADVIGGWL